MNNDTPYWKDYRFYLQEGEPVKKPEILLLNPSEMSTLPYRETRSEGTGIVFFATLEAARAYTKIWKLNGYNIHLIGPDVERLIRASMQSWGCTVAFCVHLEGRGRGFRRDVAAIFYPKGNKK